LLGQRCRYQSFRTPCLGDSVVDVHGVFIGTFTPVFFANSFASS
jgi:hypothetical protein